MLVFEVKGQPEYPGKNLTEIRENQQQTKPTYGIDARNNPGHISGRQALVSQLRHPLIVVIDVDWT